MLQSELDGGAAPVPAKVAEIDLEELAGLARLKPPEDPAECAALERWMGEMAAFAGTLGGVDAEETPLAAGAVPPENVLREDVVAPPLAREALLQNAPAVEDGYILVPRVVE